MFPARFPAHRYIFAPAAASPSACEKFLDGALSFDVPVALVFAQNSVAECFDIHRRTPSLFGFLAFFSMTLRPSDFNRQNLLFLGFFVVFRALFQHWQQRADACKLPLFAFNMQSVGIPMVKTDFTVYVEHPHAFGVPAAARPIRRPSVGTARSDDSPSSVLCPPRCRIHSTKKRCPLQTMWHRYGFPRHFHCTLSHGKSRFPPSGCKIILAIQHDFNCSGISIRTLNLLSILRFMIYKYR